MPTRNGPIPIPISGAIEHVEASSGYGFKPVFATRDRYTQLALPPDGVGPALQLATQSALCPLHRSACGQRPLTSVTAHSADELPIVAHHG
jgi:hypothetical protein